MRKRLLYAIWATMYILCVGLGSLTGRTVAAEVVFTVLGVLFFVPGGLVLADAVRQGDRRTLFQIRIISTCSLCATVVLILLNILCIGAGESAGQLLHELLILVSAPMYCCYWRVISLFLWASLLIAAFPCLWQKKEKNGELHDEKESNKD